MKSLKAYNSATASKNSDMLAASEFALSSAAFHGRRAAAPSEMGSGLWRWTEMPEIEFGGPAVGVASDPLSGFKGAVIFQKVRKEEVAADGAVGRSASSLVSRACPGSRKRGKCT